MQLRFFKEEKLLMAYMPLTDQLRLNDWVNSMAQLIPVNIHNHKGDISD